MRRWCFTLCCLLLFALPFATTTASAQETTATVTGTVTDQSGGVLPGVTVSLKHVATGRVSEGVTGADPREPRRARPTRRRSHGSAARALPPVD